MDPTNSKVPFLNSAFKLESQFRPRSTVQSCRFLVPSVHSISSFCLSTSNFNLPTQVAVLPPFTRRFFATQQTPTPVPASSGLNNASTAKVTSSSTSTSSSASTQPRGFAAFKARPFLHTLVFGFTHVSICWALVPLVYLGLSATGTSNALLGGPQVAYVLSRPIPNWLPFSDSLTSQLDPSQDQSSSSSKNSKKEKPKTVEDLLDYFLRSSIKFGWSSGGAILSSIRSSSKSLAENKDVQNLANLLDDKANNGGRLVSATMKEMKGENGSNELKSKPFYKKVWDDGLDTIGGQARKSASEIHLGNVRDAIGAWVLVKVLFPVRLPISLFLTPKVARFLTKGFAKAT